MSRLDVFAMSACYGLVGALAVALATGNLIPLGIALGYTGACWLTAEVAQKVTP